MSGALVLERLLDELPAERAPSFCVLFSSTSAVLGGVAFGSYAAANAALTAIGLRTDARRTRTRWVSAGWDTWAVTLGRVEGGFGAAMAAHSMTAEQALAAFDELLVDRPAEPGGGRRRPGRPAAARPRRRLRRPGRRRRGRRDRRPVPAPGAAAALQLRR